MEGKNSLSILTKRRPPQLRRRQDDELINIYQSAVKLLFPLDLEETYATVVNEAVRIAGARSGSIFFYEHNKFNRVYSTVPKSRQIPPRMHGNTFRALRTRKPIIIPSDDFQKIHPDAKSPKVKSIILIPLVNEGIPFGVLSTDSHQSSTVMREKVNLLVLFGSIATLAIRKAQLYAEIKQALDTRDLFISMASHELKTPMTAIKGFSQLIYDKVSIGETPPITWSRQLVNDVDRMSRLIGELLQLNQIKSGKLHFNFQNFPFRDAVYQAVLDVKQLHPDYKIIVKEQTKDHIGNIYGDRDKLMQVVINLLNNAVKYSPLGAQVTLLIISSTQVLKLEVIDKGKGINKEDLPHVFEEFYRPPQETREGLGLGLYLSKKIIEAHEGTIVIDSKINRGTRVTVCLPRKIT